MLMLKWLPLWLVDKIMLLMAWLILGDITKYGLKRPSTGPLQLKNTQGKTPVLDIGALQRIRSREIQVVPGIKKFSRSTVELENGQILDIDAVVLATGYRSNVPYWLQVQILKPFQIYSLKIFSFLNQLLIAKQILCNRRVNSSIKMDSQKRHFRTGGKAKLGYTQWGSRGEGCRVHLLTP